MVKFLMVFLIIGATSGYAEMNLDALAMIESSNNPKAINRDEGSYGLFQISPIALRDFNQQVGVKHTVKDLMREETNAHIAIWMLEVRIPQYIEAYKLPDTLLVRIAIWNWGISKTIDWYRGGGKFSKLPKQTRRFYEKYKKITGREVL
jgi:hypothetical protein